MKRRLFLTAPAVLALVCLSAGAALASWVATSSSASGYSKAKELGTPVADNANTTKTATTVHLAWTAPTTGPTPSKYDVLRDGSPVASCTNITALSCDDSGLTASTPYHYSVTAKLANNWAGQSSLAVDVTTSAPDDTRAPALSKLEMFDSKKADGTAGQDGKIDTVVVTFDEALNTSYTAGTAPWTLASVPSGGAFASTNPVVISGSTATLNLTEGAAAADTSAGNFKVTLAQNAAGIRDASGNQSSFAATAVTDKAAPFPTAVAMANGTGGQTGKVDAKKDSISIKYSEAISLSSVCAGGLPNNDTVTVTITDGGALGANDVLTVTSTACTLNLGSVALGANYVTSASATWHDTGTNASKLAWDAPTNTLTISLGTFASGTVNGTAQSTSNAVYTPSTSITDSASPSNAMTATTFTGASSSF